MTRSWGAFLALPAIAACLSVIDIPLCGTSPWDEKAVLGALGEIVLCTPIHAHTRRGGILGGFWGGGKEGGDL